MPATALGRLGRLARGLPAVACGALLAACGSAAASAGHGGGAVSVGGGRSSSTPFAASRPGSGLTSGAGSALSSASARSIAAQSPASPADAQAALTALTRYLSGLAHHDASEVTGSSEAGPLAMAAVLLDAAAINSSRGATTTTTAGPLSLAPAPGSTASVVTLQGSVTLTTSVSGPLGSGTGQDTVSGPVTVRDEGGAWKVSDFTYDGQPLGYWHETATASVSGLHVWVGFVVSYGSVTAALITLAQDSGSTDVQLRSCTLTTGAGAVGGQSDFTGPPQPTGVLRFSRIASAPTSLALHFVSSTGQADDFSLALS